MPSLLLLIRNKLERGYTECVSRVSETNSATEGPPLLAINSFLLFIGYARSGHSIVASLLDAHPHVVISHELHAMKRWTEYYNVNETANRQELFNEIWENAKSNLDGNKGYRSPNFTQKYYTLDVPGLHQGSYEEYIQIIGDKSESVNTEIKYTFVQWNLIQLTGGSIKRSLQYIN